MDIALNLGRIKKQIAEVAERVGRDPTKVRLVAVSKTKPFQVIQQGYEAGQRDFGENKVQEYMQKVDQLPQDINWHIVGRLQSNKVKYLDHRVKLIHSLDRMSLLQQLEEIGARKGLIWPVLVQVNVANDDAKAGLDVTEVGDFLEAARMCSHVHVHGLMTIGALGASVNETREFFRNLRLLRDQLKLKNIPSVDLDELSMGMSGDYVTAIEEGATIVRVGRQIFGERG